MRALPLLSACLVPMLALSGFFGGSDAATEAPRRTKRAGPLSFEERRTNNGFGRDFTSFDDAILEVNDEVKTYEKFHGKNPDLQFAIVAGPKPYDGGALLYRRVTLRNDCELPPLEKDETLVAYYTSRTPDADFGLDDPLFPLYANAWCGHVPVVQFDPATGELSTRERAADGTWNTTRGEWVDDETKPVVPGAKRLSWTAEPPKPSKTKSPASQGAGTRGAGATEDSEYWRQELDSWKQP